MDAAFRYKICVYFQLDHCVDLFLNQSSVNIIQPILIKLIAKLSGSRKKVVEAGSDFDQEEVILMMLWNFKIDWWMSDCGISKGSRRDREGLCMGREELNEVI